jgi:hypothetical protein
MDNTTTVLYPYNDKLNYALSRGFKLVDVPQNFVLSYTYELPFGKGKLGGWSINGITTFQAGQPPWVTVATNQLNNNSSNNSANITCSSVPMPKRVDQCGSIRVVFRRQRHTLSVMAASATHAGQALIIGTSRSQKTPGSVNGRRSASKPISPISSMRRTSLIRARPRAIPASVSLAPTGFRRGLFRSERNSRFEGFV